MDFRVATSPRRRRSTHRSGVDGHYRHQIQTLAYVNLDQANGGIIRNLGRLGNGDSSGQLPSRKPAGFSALRSPESACSGRSQGTRGMGRSCGTGRHGVSRSFAAFPPAVERMDFCPADGVGRNTPPAIRHCSMARAVRRLPSCCFPRGARPAIRLEPGAAAAG